jgi:cytochrome c-type biogenesis protein CcmF
VYEAVSGGRISIGPPFFNRFFVPFMLVLGVALALVPALNWKRTGFAAMSEALRLALPLALVCGLLLWFVSARMQATMVLAVVIAAWVVITHALDLARRIKRGSLPLAYAGMTCAHLGFAVSVVGVAVTATQSIEEDVRMAPQESVALGEADVRFLGVSVVSGPNFQAQQGTFVITRGAEVITLRPEKRRYLAGGAIMTEAAIDAGLFADTYVSLGEPLNEGAWAVRLHYKPLVRWIWFGTLLMALGGALAVFDARYRRLRVSRGELARTSAEAVT